MPTAAGKTRVAELMILRFLLDYRREPDAKCVYIAPFRALARDVEDSLTAAFKSIPGAKVSTFYGGYEVDPLDQMEASQARVLIVTPEKLDGMLRQSSELLSQIRLVIVDEGHIIGEGGTKNERGLRYRLLLQRLVYTLGIRRSRDERKGARLLFMSGVLPEIASFAEWITGSRSCAVELSWRPVDEPQCGDL
ncbi:MAG: DEAD/DEAH box helicase, partial [Bacteroidota bacterium]